MSKRRSKSKRRKASADSAPALDIRRLLETITTFQPLGVMLCVLAVLGGVVFGLEILKRHVHATPQVRPEKMQLVLDDPPDWVVRELWEARILESAQTVIDQLKVAPATGHAGDTYTTDDAVETGAASEVADDRAWDTQPIARKIHDTLMDSGWVSDVKKVVVDFNGVIRIDADYRRPVAMVHFTDKQNRELYVPVDGDGVCLPELYERVEPDSGWIRIFGVQEPEIPEKVGGYALKGKDALAGIRLAREISQQPYWHLINGITVLNYNGRRRRDDAHIKLLRRDGGIPIIWGSAIGEEMFEPDWRAKLRTLGMALKEGISGECDLSVYPNGVVVQKSDTLPPG